MTSKAREYNQENLVEIKSLDFNFIKDEINKGNFGLEAKNANNSSNNAVSIIKNDEKIFIVSHYEPKEEGGLRPVYKADKEIYEKSIELKEKKKLKVANQRRSSIRR